MNGTNKRVVIVGPPDRLTARKPAFVESGRL
jgi:hypothetical protein